HLPQPQGPLHRLNHRHRVTPGTVETPAAGLRGFLVYAGARQPRIFQSSSPSYSGFDAASADTRSRRAVTSAPEPAASAVPMMSATSRKSAVSNPRVASAGVPIRRPEVTIGGRGSNGTALRFTVMPTSWR